MLRIFTLLWNRSAELFHLVKVNLGPIYGVNWQQPVVEKLVKVRLFLSHSTEYLFTLELVMKETVIVQPKGRSVNVVVRIVRKYRCSEGTVVSSLWPIVMGTFSSVTSMVYFPLPIDPVVLRIRRFPQIKTYAQCFRFLCLYWHCSCIGASSGHSPS